MRGSAAFRTGVAPGGALAPGWVKNELWRKARAVPSLDLRFADDKSLVDATTGASLVTFTRASSGTFVGSDGVLRTAVTNEPRFDHNPTTGESLGLLVEEQRTNLQLRSEEFDNTGTWSRTGLSTVTANTAVAPDGSTTADALVEDASTGSHRVFCTTPSLAASTSYSLSVYVKASTRTIVRVEVRDSVGAFAAQDFNLTTQAITSAGSGTGAITALGNGWFRCTVTGTTSVLGGVGVVLIYSMQVVGNATYTGTNGTSAIFLWGAQLEAGAFPTSYIPTTTATVTRAADVASITGSNFSSWYNQTEGTVFAEMDRNTAISSSSTVVSINDNSSNNRLYNFRQDSASALTVISATGGTLDGALGVTLANTSNRNRVAAAQSLNNLAAAANGGTVLSDTSVAMPTVTQVQIGNVTGTSYFNGTIRRICFWPTRLPANTLQSITQ